MYLATLQLRNIHHYSLHFNELFFTLTKIVSHLSTIPMYFTKKISNQIFSHFLRKTESQNLCQV